MSTEALERSTLTLVSSLKQTARSFELLESHEVAMSKKRSTSFGDDLVSLGLFLYAGYRVVKTAEDAKQWWNILVTLPLTPVPVQPPLTFKLITVKPSGALKIGDVTKRRGEKRHARRSSRRREN